MNRSRNVLVGFCGGLIGGLTAMPGALPTMWCDINGIAKIRQRSLVQPFIVVMQMFALALMLARHQLPSVLMIDVAFSLPALLVGGALGIIVSRKMRDATFRRVILFLLLISGMALVV